MEHDLHPSHDGPPGALGLGQAAATRIYCAFYVFYYTTPVLAAVVSDSYLGRYITLLISAALYTLGCIVLSVSSSMSMLEKGWGIHGLVFAMILIGLGGGGFRAVIVPFIADQQPQNPPTVQIRRGTEYVITDYRLTLDYIYNLYYWSSSAYHFRLRAD
jgi:POT family proton-dependent oligopeptide transporter